MAILRRLEMTHGIVSGVLRGGLDAFGVVVQMLRVVQIPPPRSLGVNTAASLSPALRSSRARYSTSSTAGQNQASPSIDRPGVQPRALTSSLF